MRTFPLDPDRHDFKKTSRKHPIQEHFTAGDIERLLFRFLWERFNDEQCWGMSIDQYTLHMRAVLGDDRIKRQSLNPALKYAIDCGMILFSPQRHVVLQNLLRSCPNAGDVSVVDFEEDPRSRHLSQVGAEVVLELIRAIQARKPGPVHLGLAPGEKSERLVRSLAALLRLYTGAPDLVVHALTPPHAVWRPDQTPLAWLGMLKSTFCGRVEFVNLPSEPVCACGDRPEDSRCTEVRQAYERIEELDVVVTSMASSQDRHGHLGRHLERPEFSATRAELERKRWIGEVLLQPYREAGPITIEAGPRPVTLLDLESLKRIAATPGKYVVLLCGPCAACPSAKTEAILPLLERPELSVWTHLVVDFENARSAYLRRSGTASVSAGNATDAREASRRPGAALLV